MLKQLIGLLLIVLALVDPFELGVSFQVLFFILGFDLMHLFMKICVFIVDFLFDFSGLGWYLLILIAIEALVYFLKLKTLFNIVLKPLAVFSIIYFNGLGWELGVIVAGIDLLLNLGKKYI
ncbi:MAG: hypothetical protein ISS48_04925 [Candidatus Aenigmarchaeota archaeon]|nr:hypothetical protein [Candidatus Aenigmarchaeota archaeon]